MFLSKTKATVKNVVSPKNIYEQVYVIELDDLQDELLFSEKLKSLGKWYITNGKHWICHSERSFEDFQVDFLKCLTLKAEEKQVITFTIDYLPFCAILGV